MGICIISRFAFAGRFTGGGVPVTLSALHYPPMKRRGMDLEGFSRALYFSRTVCYGITVHGLPTIFISYKLLLRQLHHQFSFGGGDGKLEFIL